MMAFDREPTSSTLDPVIVTELRATLARSIQTGSHDGELKTLLARAAVDAKEKGLRAEQLMLTLKDVWYSMPDLSPRPGNDTETRLLQQLVAKCIEEYYA